MAEYATGNGAPVEEDRRHDDYEYNPQLEPRKAQAWLNLLEESERAFEDWNKHCDNIDKLYGNLADLANKSREKQFQMFWANMEVIKPTIYARPPQPVVVTKFKDRRPVPQAAAELLERCNTVAFDLAHIDRLMKAVRDDVALTGRGIAWVRYESGGSGSYYNFEKVCIDFKNRRDFLHSISRTWDEVTWVAGASYLTREEARERFHRYSGDEYQNAEYKVDREARELGGADNRERAKFWEIWDKKNRRCVWVSEGCENILDEDDSHLDLLNYFPCPAPAYGCLQRGGLVPVPDVMQYRDQLEELNTLTGRIHALSNNIRAKGFYPSGGGELADAIETAIKMNSDGSVMVPVSNWAAFGGSKEVIIWLPVAELVQTCNVLIEMRKQIIQDIYEITGLSDIIRGASDPRETLGAQELKSQYGSVRVRDKQQELVRFARDLVEIVSDIITDKFDDETIVYMSQTQLPTERMQLMEVQKLQGELQQNQMQLQQVQQRLQMMQQSAPPGGPPAGPPGGGPPGQSMVPDGGSQDPMQQQGEQAKQALEGSIQESMTKIEQIKQQPTFQQVMRFLRDTRSRAFVLDIETDSTIMIDENTEKQRRSEFIGALSQMLPQLAQMMTAEPATGQVCGELLKFAVAPFRAGRTLDGQIDNLAQLMDSKATAPRGDDPAMQTAKIQLQIEQMKDATTKQKNQADAMLKVRELQMKDATQRAKIQSTERIQLAKAQEGARDAQAETAKTNMEMIQAREQHQQKMVEAQGKARLAEQKIQHQAQQAQINQQAMVQREQDRRAQAQLKLMQPPQVRPQ